MAEESDVIPAVKLGHLLCHKVNMFDERRLQGLCVLERDVWFGKWLKAGVR